MSGDILALSKDDVTKMVIAESHLGNKTMNKRLDFYIYGRQADGTYVFNLDKAWAKLQLAARILAAVRRPEDIVFIGLREESHRAIHKACKHLHTSNFVGRFQPGTFTNRAAPAYREPAVIIVHDPSADHQAILESSYANIPVIAFTNTDSAVSYVDVAIPCNNKGKKSVGLMYWLLTREVLRMKGGITRDDKWELPDTFVQLEDEKIEEDAQVEIVEGAAPVANTFAQQDAENPFDE